MHALAPYSVKCFAQEKQGKREDKYYSLDKLPGGYDLLTLLSSFINAREGANKRGNSSRLTQSFHFFSLSRSFLP